MTIAQKIRFLRGVLAVIDGVVPKVRVVANMFTKHRSPYRVVLRLGARRKGMILSGNAADIWTIHEVFSRNTYETSAEHPKVILDLGANVGVSVTWFRMRYPEADVIAYEPNPAAFANLKKNFADDDHVVLHEAAIAGKSGMLTFHMDTESSPSSSLVHQSATTRDVTVRAVTLDEALGERAPDILKIDIEGAEFDAIHSSKMIPAVPVIVGEVHPSFAGRTEEDVQELFARLATTHVLSADKKTGARTFIATKK